RHDVDIELCLESRFVAADNADLTALRLSVAKGCTPVDVIGILVVPIQKRCEPILNQILTLHAQHGGSSQVDIQNHAITVGNQIPDRCEIKQVGKLCSRLFKALIGLL